MEAEGLAFAPAPEYQRASPAAPSRSTSTRRSSRPPRDTLPLVRELAPDVVVSDILTLAPALAAELAGVPCATLIPHVYPHTARRLPDLLARRAPAPHRRRPRAVARGRSEPVAARPRSAGAAELNDTRARSAWRRSAHVHGGISRELALVATLPAARVPAHLAAQRARGRTAHVGAARPRRGAARRRGRGAAGGAPLVLIAPSTAQDAEHRLLRAALRGLADAPVRVLAT